jgi:alanine dehydrogenase
MRVGVPREIKVHEYRVGLVPTSVAELVHAGHEVQVETGAGTGIGCSDEDYRGAGAVIAPDAAAVFDRAELIVKVKEPQLPECERLGAGQILFTYLHLAADRALTQALLASQVTAIAYETVTANDGSLPLLTPMSEVAGRMSVQVGAHCLQKESGGSGTLLGGVPGVAPARVLILGGGVAGTQATEMAVGLRADVTVLDRSSERLRALSARFGSSISTIYSSRSAVEAQVAQADLVIGSVLVRGAAAPKLVTRGMLRAMRDGGAIVDISIDQGGCFETSRPTTHAEPTYIEEGIVHYCVTNMPGAVARTSTQALNNATLPFVKALAAKGWQQACAEDIHLAQGVNVHAGRVTCEVVATDLDLEYAPLI